MRRVSINLYEEEKQALIELAERERRDPRQQAAVIIRLELERLGLLKLEQPCAKQEAA